MFGAWWLEVSFAPQEAISGPLVWVVGTAGRRQIAPQTNEIIQMLKFLCPIFFLATVVTSIGTKLDLTLSTKQRAGVE